MVLLGDKKTPVPNRGIFEAVSKPCGNERSRDYKNKKFLKELQVKFYIKLTVNCL